MTITTAQIRDSALLILAKREHSQHELQKKLLLRFPNNHTDIIQILSQLATDNMQSDNRFATAFLRNRLAKPHGKNRIIRELKQKGIKQESIDYAFETEPDIDWFALAKELKQRKFGPNAPTNYNEKAKQFRYLQYRGFNFDEINYATQDHQQD